VTAGEVTRARIRWAIDQGDALELAPAARAVLWLLAFHANGDGWAWPSQLTLAKATGRDRRTVQHALADVTAHATALGVQVLERHGHATRYRLPAVAATWGGVDPPGPRVVPVPPATPAQLERRAAMAARGADAPPVVLDAPAPVTAGTRGVAPHVTAGTRGVAPQVGGGVVPQVVEKGGGVAPHVTAGTRGVAPHERSNYLESTEVLSPPAPPAGARAPASPAGALEDRDGPSSRSPGGPPSGAQDAQDATEPDQWADTRARGIAACRAALAAADAKRAQRPAPRPTWAADTTGVVAKGDGAPEALADTEPAPPSSAPVAVETLPAEPTFAGPGQA
jgi:hypothetical protein